MKEPSTKTIISNTPGEVRLLAILDPHLAMTPPDSWKVDYMAVLEATLGQLFLFGARQQVDAVVWAGDFFHRKSPTRNPVGFVEACLRLLKKAGPENVGVAGNHDLKWGSLEGLEGQPLSLLIEAGAYQLLDWQELLIQTKADESPGFTVRIAGASYEHGKAEGCRAKTHQGAKWLVSVGHFWFGKEEGIFNGEPLYSPQFLGSGEPEIYIIGHKHEDQGIQTVGGKTYVVPGSITLLGEKAGDASRQPAAAFIRIWKDAVEAKVLRPKVPKIEELLDMEKRTQLIEENKDLEAFVNSIATTTLVGVDPKEILNQMDVQDEVKKKVEYYLMLAGE